MNHNLYSLFFDAARGEAPLLETPSGEVMTYAAMDEASARIARLLADLGLRPGDRVTVQVRKSPAVVALYLACLRAGLVFHPLNDDYRREELAFLLGDAEPALTVCDPQSASLFAGLLPAGRHLLTLADNGAGSLTERAAHCAPAFDTVARSKDDLAILLYTSGTTGKPKGAMITHGNLATNAAALVDAWGFSASDRLLHALPLYHAHGLFVGLGCTLLARASMLFLPKFDAATLIRHLPDCTVMMGVPTYYARLLREPGLDREACRHIRLFISGSAPLTPELFSAFEARTGQRILERYGMTETGMNTSNPLHGERRPGSVGLPLAGVEVRITDTAGQPLPAGSIGNIELRGPNVFPGYWRAPEKTAEAFTADGFFRTGDLGCLGTDGYLDIVGRAKDLIISGGLNVYPREVEILLDSLPGVAESAVIGVPHADFGEAVVAVITARPGTTPGEPALIEALRERLARFKIPKRVLVVGELPRNAMGKVEKTTLRKRYADLFTTGP